MARVSKGEHFAIMKSQRGRQQPYFDLRGPVIAPDLLRQMNNIGQVATLNGAQLGAAGGAPSDDAPSSEEDSLNDDDALPSLRPAEAALLMGFGELIAHLSARGLVEPNHFAEDLLIYTNSMPEDARPMMILLAQALRPSTSKFKVVIANDDDRDNQ